MHSLRNRAFLGRAGAISPSATLGAMPPRCEPEVWAERFADSELREPMPVADYMRWLKETLEEEVHLNSPMMPLVGLMDVFV